MSYTRGLGQAKIVPGQISFQTLPDGRSGFQSLEPLVRDGLPIAPYIEHGSWRTGKPDIMRYGLDPYRGIMGLGQTVGESIRRLEAQDYVVRCDNWAQVRGVGGRHVRGMRAAMKVAKQALSARDGRSDTCRIFLPTDGAYLPGNEVVSIRRRPKPPEKYDVRFNQGLSGAHGGGLGQVLTSSLCDPTSVSRAFQERLTGALNAGSQAALIGGAIAGLVGGLAGKRSLAGGAVAGALVGWTANLVWTATHRA